MSLPHLIFQCSQCPFILLGGPDRFAEASASEQGARRLWGNLCACDHCGSIHLIAESGAVPGSGRYLFTHIRREAGKRKPSQWCWLQTEQFFEYLPGFATGLEPGFEIVDISSGRCTACGQRGLKAWLYPGVACPSCKVGAILASSTEES